MMQVTHWEPCSSGMGKRLLSTNKQTVKEPTTTFELQLHVLLQTWAEII